jgi:hypothetical protein
MGNLNLTPNIQFFTDLVVRAAQQTKVWKEGMKLIASHCKRKKLADYLPPSERYKLKTGDRKSSQGNLPRSRTTSNEIDRLAFDHPFTIVFYSKFYQLNNFSFENVLIQKFYFRTNSSVKRKSTENLETPEILDSQTQIKRQKTDDRYFYCKISVCELS